MFSCYTLFKCEIVARSDVSWFNIYIIVLLLITYIPSGVLVSVIKSVEIYSKSADIYNTFSQQDLRDYDWGDSFAWTGMADDV